jgi:hypothetical protein
MGERRTRRRTRTHMGRGEGGRRGSSGASEAARRHAPRSRSRWRRERSAATEATAEEANEANAQPEASCPRWAAVSPLSLSNWTARKGCIAPKAPYTAAYIKPGGGAPAPLSPPATEPSSFSLAKEAMVRVGKVWKTDATSETSRKRGRGKKREINIGRVAQVLVTLAPLS